MVSRATTLSRPARTTDGLEAVFRTIRAEHEVPEAFPAEVLAAAEVAAGTPDLPDRDERDIPFVTIDPPGAMDLDQALHSLGLQPTDAAPRDWLQRSHAALRLLRLQAAWLVAQLLLALVVILATPWLSLAG